MALSDTRIRAASSSDKDYKLADEKGMFLLVTKAGSKYWRMKYRVAGKEKMLALGVYPDVTLAMARKRRDDARGLLEQGIDPILQKRALESGRQDAATNSFELIAREWLIKRKDKSESGDKSLIRMLEKDLFPVLGTRPVHEITPPELLQALRRIS